MSLKLKSQPEDFEVEELTDFPLEDGPFAVYLLTKRSLGTPEAITAIERRWQLSRRQISYGGLKDKHAVTRQWLTIHRGPRRNLEQTNFALIYQGQARQEFTPQAITGNRFAITLRGLTKPDARAIVDRLPDVARDGVPNYFDDQRFGSVGQSGEFIARAWCQGNYERTLWLALAEQNTHDRPEDREEKRILREHWNKWPECKQALPRSSRRSIVTYLCDHPTDFRRAVALVRQDLRSLYLSAFQSHFWNAILAEQLSKVCPADTLQTVRLETQTVPFFRKLNDEQRTALHALVLPLPSARLHFEDGDPRLELYERVAQSQGLELRELRVKYPRDSFFSKGERAAVIVPQEATGSVIADTLHEGQHAAVLRFVLPRGAYATIVVKQLAGNVSSD